MKYYLLFILVSCTALPLNAQNTQKPCTAAEARQFDFWLGDWNLYSADTLTGTNSVQKVMDGCTVQENFSSPKTGYTGKSWSVYSQQRKSWQQTWVDNQGGYIHLTGGFKDGIMTLTTQPQNIGNGKEVISRMIFYNITVNNFDWNWESTSDGGITWQSSWKIHYIRK